MALEKVGSSSGLKQTEWSHVTLQELDAANEEENRGM